MLKWVLQNQARLNLTFLIFLQCFLFFIIKESWRSKRKERKGKKEKREILAKFPCPPEKNPNNNKTNLLLVPGKVSAALEVWGGRVGCYNSPRVGGGGGGCWYRRDSAQQGGLGADSCTKQRWKHVPLGFAVLCWELLGSFSIAALFGAAGFYTSLSSWETNPGKTTKMCFFPH